MTRNQSRNESFVYLPGTKKEVDEIKKLATSSNISAELLSGINCTEESFKALTGAPSPAVLHIATHGFYFPDPALKNMKTPSSARMSVFIQSGNPLMRSGLVFAGANTIGKQKTYNDLDDGILTAYEVSNMYLPNTKLVVLSACESGLGEIQGSEGVYGLQRSFKIAGAEYLLMSLWEVPDLETSEFMTTFYKNVFDNKDISQAFYQTQDQLKKKYKNEPYKWAAWILLR